MHKASYWLGGLIVGTLSITACKPTAESSPDDTSIATSAPSTTMHPSWDADNNGINDCETNGSCDHTIDYTKPRPAPVTTPTFECNKAADSSVEQLICKDPVLAQLDQLLARIYGEATEKAVNEHPPTLAAEQRGWIKGRNECWKSDDKFTCVKAEYEQRIAELQARYELVVKTAPVHFQCGSSPADEIVVTFYETTPPTLIAERGDQTSLMYSVPSGSGSKYEGRNESFWEHQGEARVVWGYEAPELVCKKAD
ncbi:MliC family protein [Cellvibrio sp. NN19]|uniref:MliC family protein n=1 Tax=Cellvibrio chitinivorans TaxID=3102792 RepID=UPI002B401A55|nr:MliC family protein [Cellvibrio sp. NN19]